MKVWCQFHAEGYGNPYPGDYEVFRTLKDAKTALWRRFDGERAFPCVGDDACFTVYTTKPDGDGQDYPDFLLTIGPRGGIRKEVC